MMGILTQVAHAGHVHETQTTTYTASNGDGAVAMIALGFLGLFMIFVLLLSYVVTSFLLGRIFKKAGVDQWIAWVPIYNSWKLLELGGQQGFWAVLALVPVVNIVSAIFMYIAMYNIGLKLQKEGWFVLLAIFVTPVWLIWLAFDSSTWNEKGGPAPAKTPVKKAAK